MFTKKRLNTCKNTYGKDDIPNTIGNIPRFPTVFIQVTFLTFQPHPTSTSAYELPGAHRVYQVNPVVVPLPSSTRSQRLCSTTADATPLGSVQARLWMPRAGSFQRDSYIPFRFEWSVCGLRLHKCEWSLVNQRIKLLHK